MAFLTLKYGKRLPLGGLGFGFGFGPTGTAKKKLANILLTEYKGKFLQNL